MICPTAEVQGPALALSASRAGCRSHIPQVQLSRHTPTPPRRPEALVEAHGTVPQLLLAVAAGHRLHSAADRLEAALEGGPEVPPHALGLHGRPGAARCAELS